jgi:signal transduction histidine kinase
MASNESATPGGVEKIVLLLVRVTFAFAVSLPVLVHPSASGLLSPLQATTLLAAFASNVVLARLAPSRLLAGRTRAGLAVADGLWAWWMLASAPVAYASLALVAPALLYGLALGWLDDTRHATDATIEAAVAARTAEVQRGYEESVAAHRTKREFVANMSHELRTPLNIIIGYTDMLRDDESQPGADEHDRLTARIHTAATNLLHLVDMVLDLEKLDAGKIPVDRLAVPMARFAAEAERRERIPLAAGVRLTYEIDPDLPVVETDPAKLTMVLDNLVGNAIKFTKRGTITVRIHDHAHEGCVQLEVEDTGPGIDPGQLATIFEPFHQVERSSDNPFGGVGLGLAIVRRYVRLLGGTIAVRSTATVGTCFTLRLPHRPPGTTTESDRAAAATPLPAGASSIAL